MNDVPEEYKYGEIRLIQSRTDDRLHRTYTTVRELDASKIATTVLIRARVHNSRQKGNICFLVLRDQNFTCQATFVKSEKITKSFITFTSKIPKESIIDIEAEVVVPLSETGFVTGVTQSNVELIPKSLFVISRATPTPISLTDLETPQPLLDIQETKVARLEAEMEPLLIEQKNIQGKHLQGKVIINDAVRIMNDRKSELATKKSLLEKIQSELTTAKHDIIQLEQLVSNDIEEVKAIKQQVAAKADAHRQTIEDKKRYQEIQDQLKPLQKRKEEAQVVRTVGLNLRLDNRVIDLRTRANQAIFRIQSGVCTLFRTILLERGFIEIHSPKLIATASEGGSGVFKVKYFNTDAYLAQSPQLYKQMAVTADLQRVFEIGPVFRAENSNTHRHMTEFTGLDLEMAFHEHYHEVLDVLEDTYLYIFDGLNNRYQFEIEAVRQQFPFENIQYKYPVKRFKWSEIIELLREHGENIGDFDDISTVQEKLLGQIIRSKYGIDFYAIDKFPLSIRPFYTMMDPDDPRYSNSYDFFLRGEEICSGAQRIHDSNLLSERAKCHNIDLQKIHSYIDAFKYGAYPHAGGGAGLERIVMLFLGLGNIRRSSLFPRDPSRLSP